MSIITAQEDFQLQNTWSMNMSPQPPEDYVAMASHGHATVELLPVFSGDAFGVAVQYPVIVENWQKAKAGRVKKAWHEAFTQAERNTIGRYYGKFYRWHLISGTPKRVSCRIGTLHLLQRAVHFLTATV